MRPSILEIKHEINNLLFKLETSWQILEDGNVNREEISQISSILRKNTDILKQVFDSLFAVEALEKGKMKKESVDLKNLLRIYLNIDIPKTDIHFSSDMLKTALKNLQMINKPVSVSKEDDRLILYIQKPEGKIDIFLLEVAKYILNKAGVEIDEKDTDCR